MPLNEQQTNCLRNLQDFIKSDNKLFLVNGEAGSGKTYLIKQFIQEISDDKSVAIGAPTNKACKVLSSRIKNDSVPIQTVHRFLGLTMKQIEEKQVLFKSVWNFSQMENYDVFIVDEGSMIDKMIFDIIYNKIHSILGENTKVIYFADEAQIQPVGEERSQIFRIKNRFDLTEIVRQSKNSPLMPLIQATRQLVLGSQRIKFDEFLINNFRGNEGVLIYPYEKWMNQVLKSFNSKNYEQNPFGHSKIITWRNRTSDRLAYQVRAKLDKVSQPYEAGDLIYTKEAVKHPHDENVIVLQNCSELEITKAKAFDYSINGQSIKAWKLTVWEANDDTRTSQTINIIDPNHTNIFRAIMTEMAEAAKEWQRENPKGDSSKLWRKFYQHKFNFAEVSHIHAITVRRSQGSEWENCFVWLPDLIASRDWSHLYTAFTRTKKRLIIGV